MATPSPEHQPSLTAPSPGLLQLPPEILLMVTSFLPNQDLKSLRLASKLLGETTPLPFSRVFLSANLLDVKVFRSIANHPEFRKQVTEIIWDDARFVAAPASWEDYTPFINRNDLKMDVEEGCPAWFLRDCKENIRSMNQRKSNDVDRPDHMARQQQADAQMPLKDCWKYYSQVLNDQQSVIESRDDEKAFIYGLEQFPQLRRVTITPAAHGRTFSPLYRTPTIRAFPYGFNYPIPRGWHICSAEGIALDPLPWSEAKEEYKELWRGARIALRVLSTIEDHNISELCFNSKRLATGINFMIFAQPCEEYNHFAAIMKRPGFRHLDLSILVGNSGIYDYAGLTSGHFFKALSLARELTHLNLTLALEDGRNDLALPLKEILPIQQWPNLYHLGLFNFSVNVSDVIDLLGSVSSSMRSVELGSLRFPNSEGLWSGLLERMRDELDWSKRDQSLRPAVRITMDIDQMRPGRFALLTDEVMRFLYDSGEIPTTRDIRNYPKLGMGTLHDIFEPEYTRPNLGMREHREMGIIL
ncbi:uncharacterized protein N7503_001035 [Penicillium pulvis]|uniref:uncharacterized protein n=1 Tax=Penicillium pulvis TaxID=1562058 RepID=UPI0025495BCF|nr:uncharacterized protein N7503_001035 [Penicillium pulvis]KAJ5814285.1 hypothetical protein N7503_001035 [Penicillium pulvis]